MARVNIHTILILLSSLFISLPASSIGPQNPTHNEATNCQEFVEHWWASRFYSDFQNVINRRDKNALDILDIDDVENYITLLQTASYWHQMAANKYSLEKGCGLGADCPNTSLDGSATKDCGEYGRCYLAGIPSFSADRTCEVDKGLWVPRPGNFDKNQGGWSERLVPEGFFEYQGVDNLFGAFDGEDSWKNAPCTVSKEHLAPTSTGEPNNSGCKIPWTDSLLR